VPLLVALCTFALLRAWRRVAEVLPFVLTLGVRAGEGYH
jgi:hypothetical protein